MYLEISKMAIELISVQCCVSYRNAKQVTGFYMKCKTGLKWVNVTDIPAGNGVLLVSLLLTLNIFHTLH